MSVQEQKSRRRTRPEAAGAADHQVRIALAAYFIAEKRGFEAGHELEDWLAAEAEIDKARSAS